MNCKILIAPLRTSLLALSVGVGATLIAADSVRAADPAFWSWAQTPPMGWNSWDGFATTVTEAQTRAQADFMAANLKRHGWEYIVVDIQWYEPNATGFDYRKGAKLDLDEWGRLIPAANKFPSATDGQGFKPLADYVHSLGLKFGVHLMRGIPRQAVAAKTPVKGTRFTAADIADTNSVCPWNTDMYGVDMTKPGAQEYYNSVFDQFAAWGLDFVKVDDLSRPYHTAEIAAIRKAIDQTGRRIVFSTSPGATPLADGGHISTHANMWRISDDFWDKWSLLFDQFARVRDWTPWRGPGHWPDADMLPIGVLQMGKNKTHFTRDEQITLMSLWSIARSPLMIGADLTKLDDFTLSLLTNDDVLAVNQNSTGNHQLFQHDGLYAWVADVPGSPDKYLAVFNTRSQPKDGGPVAVPVKLSELGFAGAVKIENLWTHENLGAITNEFAPDINSHGSGLYRVSAATTPPAGKLAPKPLYRDPPFDAPTDPVLCYNAEAKKWFMYYTQRRATATNAPGVEWVHGCNIGMAESSDGGATWTYRGTADIHYGKDAHPDDYTYWAPEVIWVNGTYHMFLIFVPGIFSDWNHPREIAHLTSQDGVKWDTVGKVDLHSDRVIDACVMQLPGGGWRMWYKDERKSPTLSYADSPDLFHWEPKGNAVTNFSGEGPKAFHWKGSYWLVADCWRNGMRVWKSDDCLNWKLQAEPLLGSHGDVVVSGDRAWWFYFTEQGRRAAISVVELSVADGKLLHGDPQEPTYIDLKSEREKEE